MNPATTTALNSKTIHDHTLGKTEFSIIIKRVGIPETVSNKVEKYYGHWSSLVKECIFDTTKTLKAMELIPKNISIIMFVKHKMHFDNEKYYEIANCDDSLTVQN